MRNVRNSVKVSIYQLVEYDIPHRLRHNLYSVLARHGTWSNSMMEHHLYCTLVKYINRLHQNTGLCQQSFRAPVMSEQDQLCRVCEW